MLGHQVENTLHSLNTICNALLISNNTYLQMYSTLQVLNILSAQTFSILIDMFDLLTSYIQPRACDVTRYHNNKNGMQDLEHAPAAARTLCRP